MPTDAEQVMARVSKTLLYAKVDSVMVPISDKHVRALRMDDLRALLTLARQYRGGDGMLSSLKEGAAGENEKLRKALGYLASGGRLTADEYLTVKALVPFPIQGWEWDLSANMWKRRDFADVDEIERLRALSHSTED